MPMLTTTSTHSGTCLALTKAISKSRTVQEIYAAALEALRSGLGVERSSILLFDPDGVMRFKAYRGLSDTYRRAVEGHTPWRPDSPDPQPIVIADVGQDASLISYVPIFEAEGIAALAFIPLISLDRVVGKFMLYYAVPGGPTGEELELASVIAAQVAFAVERTRTEDQARRSEERLRFALDAASMGTWVRLWPAHRFRASAVSASTHIHRHSAWRCRRSAPSQRAAPGRTAGRISLRPSAASPPVGTLLAY